MAVGVALLVVVAEALVVWAALVVVACNEAQATRLVLPWAGRWVLASGFGIVIMLLLLNAHVLVALKVFEALKQG